MPDAGLPDAGSGAARGHAPRHVGEDAVPVVLEGEIDRFIDAQRTDQAFGDLALIFRFIFHNAVILKRPGSQGQSTSVNRA